MMAPIDLRGMQYMPLQIERLRRSKAWLICKRRPDLAFHMLNLWMVAWHEVPAGSMENDDDVLADAAMCDVRKWPRIKDDVMRGWTLADDGRLYHETVREIAVDTFEKRTIWRERKRRQRVGQSQLSTEDNAGTDEGHYVGQSRDNALKGKGKVSTVAYATAADAADPAKLMFDSGRTLLAKAGHDPKRAGAMLGKWRKDFGDAALIAAIGSAVREDAQDPVEYIVGCLRSYTNGGSRTYRKSGFDVVLDEIRSGAGRPLAHDAD